MTSPLSEEKLAEIRERCHPKITPEQEVEWREECDAGTCGGCVLCEGPGIPLFGRETVLALLDALDAGREIARTNHDELVAANQEIERLQQERDDALELAHQDSPPSGVLRDRLRWVLGASLANSALDAATENDVDQITDALLPVITAEVSARVSEGQVAVPEPLAKGYVQRVVGKRAPDGWIEVVMTVSASKEELQPLLQGVDVGIWHASLAEQAADNEGLLDAMTAVAKRLYEGWAAYVPDDDDKGLWTKGVIPDGYEAEYEEWMTDAERRALQLLSEGESE